MLPLRGPADNRTMTARVEETVEIIDTKDNSVVACARIEFDMKPYKVSAKPACCVCPRMQCLGPQCQPRDRVKDASDQVVAECLPPGYRLGPGPTPRAQPESSRSPFTEEGILIGMLLGAVVGVGCLVGAVWLRVQYKRWQYQQLQA